MTLMQKVVVVPIVALAVWALADRAVQWIVARMGRAVVPDMGIVLGVVDTRSVPVASAALVAERTGDMT
ncbi:hypothetical protein [Bifidobacterium goeldii]|uniref:hypothetical protein n=1 Tax=Bifidobacterium goeldii TaxID=2306975 RepID=UPI000F7ED35E|nr:hypothetical protein [Bifidobacterium goeldii]